jgi:SSS family transporter
MSLWFLLVYLALQLGLGLWLSRGIKSEGDFFVGGRKLGTALVAFSMFATWFGAETCLGSSGAIYESGLSGARADPLGYSLCLLFLGVFLAVPLWRGGYMTLADLYRARYGVGIERLAVLVLVPSSIIWAAAQIRAFGQVVSATMDVEVTLAIYCAAAFVIAYTFFGGLLGDVYTDLIQGIILSLSLVVMLVVGISALGGPADAITGIESQRWSLLEASENPWQQIDRWSIPIMGSLVAQELIARVAASKSAQTARNASFWACALYLFVGSSPVVLGLLGPHLVPNLDDPESLLPTLASRLLPSFWYAVFSCALISAILSTIDSVLLACSALLSHNVAAPLFNVKSERGRLHWARGFVVASGIIALVIALYAESIYDLVETASAFGTAGVLVTTFIALYLPRGGREAAAAALIAGLITTPIAEYLLELSAPFLTSIAMAGLSYALVAVLRPQPRAAAS